MYDSPLIHPQGEYRIQGEQGDPSKARRVNKGSTNRLQHISLYCEKTV